MEDKKIFYTVGELSEMFDVNASLIRHWTSQFDIIKPKRNNKGNRLFSPEDVENFKLIYHLVKERGMTLAGAKKALRRGSVVAGSSLERDAKIMERLQHLRSLLVEIKSTIKEGDDEFDREQEQSRPQLTEVELLALKAKIDSSRDVDAKDRELFAFYEQALFNDN